MRAVELRGDRVLILDQTLLPHSVRVLECRTPEEVVEAIREMRVRGAPAVGMAGAMALALAALRSRGSPEERIKRMEEVAERLRKTRPTGADLFRRLEEVMEAVRKAARENREIGAAAVEEIRKRMGEYDEVERRMGEHGARLIPNGATVLTHCNAGWLATPGRYGTALSALRFAKRWGKRIRVLATETRPLLQGARLTAWELAREGIEVRVITDGAVGYFMSKGMVDLVVVGADRVFRDGHVINKIGTYPIACVAQRHRIPFYVFAPLSTFDPAGRVEEVEIEQREGREVEEVAGKRVVPEGVEALNPAFDVTPPELITAIVTEKGILRPPFSRSIPGILGKRD
ncbi:MAG: S-methyl-5-thioribose-1-phosphate isomerase [Candidatus Hadarchaeales archaeon]